jgi:hypothetical protein
MRKLRLIAHTAAEPPAPLIQVVGSTEVPAAAVPLAQHLGGNVLRHAPWLHAGHRHAHRVHLRGRLMPYVRLPGGTVAHVRMAKPRRRRCCGTGGTSPCPMPATI